MYLKKVKICNFRGFDEKGIEAIFDKGVNAIVGENNNGKSSLIDAIRIAFSMLNYKKEIYFQKSDFHIDLSGKIADSAQFDIYLKNVPNYLFEIWNPETKDSGEFHVKFYISKSPKVIDRLQYKIWGGQIEGKSLSFETLEAIDVAFLGALRDAETEMKPSRHSKLARLLGNIADSEEKRKNLVGVLDDANRTIMEKDEIIKTSEIINKNLSNIEQDILSQQIDVGLVQPRFESISSSLRTWIKSKWVFISSEAEIFIELEKIIQEYGYSQYARSVENGVYLKFGILFKEINGNSGISDDFKEKIYFFSQRNFELNQNGLGYNNLIFMATILGDMSIKKDGVLQNLFLIEEPEAHLHPQLQELVHNFFLDQHGEDNNIQVIYTSHSPTLVSKIGLDKINLIYEKDYRIECLPTSMSSLDNEDRKYLKKYLDVTKSQLFFSKGIIFVEGISEALLVPEIAKYIDKPLDKYAVEVVNVGSLAFKPFVNLLLNKNDGTRTFAKASIITDDDRCTKKDDKDLYINKDIDFNDEYGDIQSRLDKGTPSDRFIELQDICKSTEINISSAVKTLEFELPFCDENINIMLDILVEIFPKVAVDLKAKINKLSNLKEKQLCIWLFIRMRDKRKGEIAQKLCMVIQEQREKIKNGEKVKYEFKVPRYIKESIEFVTGT